MAAAPASASEELVRALNKGYKSFQWPRYKPVTRQPSLSLKMTAPHQHASINQMHAASPQWSSASHRRCRRATAVNGASPATAVALRLLLLLLPLDLLSLE